MTKTLVPMVELDGDFTVHTVAGYVEESDIVPARHSDVGVDQDVFRSAMRVLAAGVVIVTTRVDGRPWGLTISSCCSLTLEPPQLLASLRSTTVSCQEILRTGRFGVSILASCQKELAETGAAVGCTKYMDEFCEHDGHHRELVSPMISGALFHLDCTVADSHPVGDHQIIVGLVTQGISSDGIHDLSPLLYFDRTFWNLGEQL